MYSDRYKNDVKDAAQYLDQYYPGWAEKLDGKEIHLMSPTHCPLGILEGYYLKGLTLYRQRTGNYGLQRAFCVPSCEPLWYAEIEQRVRPVEEATSWFQRLRTALHV